MMHWFKKLLTLTVITSVILLSGCGNNSNTNNSPSKIDNSPHQENFVTVNGVKLHYLDWGGQGETILFLSGLGGTAHIYDDLAPLFTNKYHVIALTRRGFGQSDQPASGYEVDTRVKDIIGLLDHLHLQKVHVIGHSIAGFELTRMATLYPDRIEKMVYLDASFEYQNYQLPDSDDDYGMDSGGPLSEPTPTPADYQSIDKTRAFYQRVNLGNLFNWTAALENDFRQNFIVKQDGSVEARTNDTILAAIDASIPDVADLKNIKMPVLAIYAKETFEHIFPWLYDREVSPEIRQQGEAFVTFYNQAVADWYNYFSAAIPQAKVTYLDNCGHLLFIEKKYQVYYLIKNFL